MVAEVVVAKDTLIMEEEAVVDIQHLHHQVDRRLLLGMISTK